MQAADIRFLFAYDRWATKQVLTVLDGLDSTVWSRPNDVGERGLGSILVYHLGASQRWRIGLQTQGTDDGPEPELEPLPRSTSCGNAGRPSGSRSMPGCPP